MTAPTVDELARIPLLQALTPEALRQAASLFTVERFPRGAIVIREGARVDTFFFVLTGRARFYWRDDEGRQIDIADVPPGGHFADATVGGEPALASLMAVEDLRVAVLPMASFERLLLEHPALALAYIKRLIVGFRRRLEASRRFAMDDVYGRIVQVLDAEAQPDEGARVARLTQVEIGRRVGATREMVGRILRDLERGNYVRLDRGRLVVLRALPSRW